MIRQITKPEPKQARGGVRMPEHLRNALFSITLLGLVVGGVAHGQEVDQSDPNFLLFQFDEIEGTPLDDFIKLGETLTGLQFTYEAADTKEVKLRFIGKKNLPREQFWAYFQAVLRSKDFLLVPFGNVSPPDRPNEGPNTGYFAIRRISGGVGGGAQEGRVKSQAPVVDVEELEAYRYDAGVVLTTSFTLSYVNAQETVNMLSGYFTDHSLESVRSINNSNSFVVTGFAQTLWGIKQLVDLIDTKPSEFTPKLARVDLQYAAAEEIKPIVDNIIQAERGNSGGTGGNNRVPSTVPAHLQEPEPHLEADPRTNSLIVVAAAQSLEKITGYIRMLDTEGDSDGGDTHVYRLKNSSAEDLAEVLEEWAGKVDTGGGNTGGGQAGGGSGGVQEQAIVILAEAASNSLIISASKSRYSQILEMVKKLDVRRRQVLIESALVEISGTLTDQLGVELGYLSLDDQKFAADGTLISPGSGAVGITNFGLSDKFDNNGDGIADYRIPVGVGAGPLGGADAISSAVTGISAGIFSNDDFSVPLILNALKGSTDSNVLSMPSVLVNDNEEAVIKTLEERPTFTNTLSGNGNSQESFQGFEEAGIQLNISPSISAGNYLRMLVAIEVSAFQSLVGDPPPKNTRELETNVTLPDGHTMVIGGIVSDRQTNSNSRIPFLGELPLIGWLFGTNTDSDDRTNLYVFITPHIISDDFANLDDLSLLKKKEMEALNGKISLVDPDWDENNADTRILNAGVSGVFDMPSYHSPPAGEVKKMAPTKSSTTNK